MTPPAERGERSASTFPGVGAGPLPVSVAVPALRPVVGGEAVGARRTIARRSRQRFLPRGGPSRRSRRNSPGVALDEPAVLLVDEPTSALDGERGAAVVDLLTSLTREHGTATVLVTHDTAHLGSVDAVVEVVDGRLRSLVAAGV